MGAGFAAGGAGVESVEVAGLAGGCEGRGAFGLRRRWWWAFGLGHGGRVAHCWRLLCRFILPSDFFLRSTPWSRAQSTRKQTFAMLSLQNDEGKVRDEVVVSASAS